MKRISDLTNNVEPENELYPFGKAKAASTATSADGSKVTAAITNQVIGFYSAALKEAGITPNDRNETATESQILQAINTLIAREAERVGNQKLALAGGVVIGDLRVNGDFVNGNLKSNGNMISHNDTPTMIFNGDKVQFTAIPNINGSDLILKSEVDTQNQALQSQINTNTTNAQEAKQDAADALQAAAPVGCLFPFVGAQAPAGYAICDGSNFDKSTNPVLAAMLPDGKLPDLRGAAPFGIGSGEELNKHYDGQIKSHSHSANTETKPGTIRCTISGRNADGRQALNHPDRDTRALAINETYIGRGDISLHAVRMNGAESSTTVNASGYSKNTTDHWTVNYIIRLG
jgi:microcystin-dependent protein